MEFESEAYLSSLKVEWDSLDWEGGHINLEQYRTLLMKAYKPFFLVIKALQNHFLTTPRWQDVHPSNPWIHNLESSWYIVCERGKDPANFKSRPVIAPVMYADTLPQEWFRHMIKRGEVIRVYLDPFATKDEIWSSIVGIRARIEKDKMAKLHKDHPGILERAREENIYLKVPHNKISEGQNDLKLLYGYSCWMPLAEILKNLPKLIQSGKGAGSTRIHTLLSFVDPKGVSECWQLARGRVRKGTKREMLQQEAEETFVAKVQKRFPSQSSEKDSNYNPFAEALAQLRDDASKAAQHPSQSAQINQDPFKNSQEVIPPNSSIEEISSEEPKLDPPANKNTCLKEQASIPLLSPESKPGKSGK